MVSIATTQLCRCSMKAAADNMWPVSVAAPLKNCSPNRQSASSSVSRFLPSSRVIKAYLMTRDVRSQTYRDSETPRHAENGSREVSFLPWAFWTLSIAGFLPWSDFDWSIRFAFICTIKCKECWKGQIEEALSDYSSKNKIVKIALDGWPGLANCSRRSANPTGGLFLSSSQTKNGFYILKGL